jgi:hypothetical protein
MLQMLRMFPCVLLFQQPRGYDQTVLFERGIFNVKQTLPNIIFTVTYLLYSKLSLVFSMNILSSGKIACFMQISRIFQQLLMFNTLKVSLNYLEF